MSRIVYVECLCREFDLDELVKNGWVTEFNGKDIYVIPDDLAFYCSDYDNDRARLYGIDEDGNCYTVYYYLNDNYVQARDELKELKWKQSQGGDVDQARIDELEDTVQRAEEAEEADQYDWDNPEFELLV